ncbi:MAG: Leucine carboxyl methyltransferase [Methanosaeta sp. PtaU1.Bin060]|jgi:methyltransferase (TIGR00027 family)|nr:MAG: Leucine carboxyl methyltransferase [Methanosaeta sp. PtaU1.Bin060]
MQKSDSATYYYETGLKSQGPSKMAEAIAIHRLAESAKPEDERICYDPYAVHFISPEILEFRAKNPEKAKALSEHYERLFSGFDNSVRARVRYFDDAVKAYLNNGLKQLVILGAGYDTRAYRIEGLKEKVKVFEVDHPATQSLKKEKIKKIFGVLPEHVVYVPADFEVEKLGQRLRKMGYDSSKKTLFLMEGFVMYIPPKAVDETLSFIVNNSAKGSAVLFDYFPQSVVDGTCESDDGKNIRKFAAERGEPLQFGIVDGGVDAFLSQRRFSKIKNVTSEDYKKAYFHGANKDRTVCSLMSFAHAIVK